jgi:hypothetical protein
MGFGAQQAMPRPGVTNHKLEKVSFVKLRHSIAAAAALFVSVASASAAELAFTAQTAPDLASRKILAHPLLRLDEGALPGTDPRLAVHANFNQVIEQNFARLGKAGTATLVDNLSELELHDLAQLYVNAAADSGHKMRLLDVLANRLDEAHLARIARHFGYTETNAAVARIAPEKLAQFSSLADVAVAAPVAGVALAHVAQGGVRPMGPVGIGQFLNMTPYEIYLDFRTAPVGALGVGGSLLESAGVIGVGVSLAWYGGQKAGDVLAPLIETYDPTLWDAIGGTIAEIVNNYTTATTQVQSGQYMSALGSMFGAQLSGTKETPSVNYDCEYHGGDYDSMGDWSAYDASMGSGGGQCFNGSCYEH